MKKLTVSLLIAISTLFFAFQPGSAPELQMTDGYSVRFKTKKASGFFHTLKGKIFFDENNLASSSFNMQIDVASISMGNSLKTWHSKRPKWFNAKEFPQITFVSNKISRTDKGYLATGKLKMRGVEKDITIPFTFVSKVFTGHMMLLRSDYHVGKTKGMSKLVGDTIKIDITVPVAK